MSVSAMDYFQRFKFTGSFRVDKTRCTVQQLNAKILDSFQGVPILLMPKVVIDGDNAEVSIDTRQMMMSVQEVMNLMAGFCQLYRDCATPNTHIKCGAMDIKEQEGTLLVGYQTSILKFMETYLTKHIERQKEQLALVSSALEMWKDAPEGKDPVVTSCFLDQIPYTDKLIYPPPAPKKPVDDMEETKTMPAVRA